MAEPDEDEATSGRPSRHMRRHLGWGRRPPPNPYDVGPGRREQPKFFLSEEGQKAADEYTEWLNKQAQWQIDNALNEAIFDARHFAVQKAKGSDTGEPLEALVGWDREAVALVIQMRSAERVGQTLTRATNVLAFATLGLFVATIALVIVTVWG
jgi:hypothetical protein